MRVLSLMPDMGKVWATQQLKVALASLELDPSKDRQTLVDLAIYWQRNEPELRTTLLPALGSCSHDSGFILFFLSRMSKDKKIPSYLFEILLPSAIESLGISDSASHQNIIEVLSHCQTLGLSSELQRMTAKMTRKALEIRDEHLDSVCLPVFRLILSSKDASNILNLGPVQAMYRNVLNYYISRCVQPKPVFNQDWHRARRGCGKPRCSECKTLDEFLTSSTQSFTELRCKAQIQIHLDSQLQTAYPWREQLYETTQARGVMTVKKIPTEFNHELRVWEQRQNQAKKVLLSFEQGSLKVVLGDAFGIIMSLQTLHFDHKPTPPETPAIDVTKNAPPQITNSTTSQGPASARVTPLASSNRSFVNASVGTLKTKI